MRQILQLMRNGNITFPLDATLPLFDKMSHEFVINGLTCFTQGHLRHVIMSRVTSHFLANAFTANEYIKLKW